MTENIMTVEPGILLVWHNLVPSPAGLGLNTSSSFNNAQPFFIADYSIDFLFSQLDYLPKEEMNRQLKCVLNVFSSVAKLKIVAFDLTLSPIKLLNLKAQEILRKASSNL
jgi:hypothetical protein